MLVLVGSQNPVKIAATRAAFSDHFVDIKVAGIKVHSGVSPQPVGEETYRGAFNRAESLHRIDREQGMDARFFVGIEGGVAKVASRWFAFGCMCILNTDGLVGRGTTAHFELPQSVGLRIDAGEELGPVMDELTGKKDTKMNQGAVGILTRGRVDRTHLYQQGIQVALIPFINKDLYGNLNFLPEVS